MIDRITLHWTAGQYQPNAVDRADYHLLILRDGSLEKCHNFDRALAHCWHQNTGNIGIAVCGMWQATARDFGECAFTQAQLGGMIEAAALVCLLKNLPVMAVGTHAERAIEKGYFGERWDFAVLAPQARITPQTARQTGNLLRGEIARGIDSIKKMGIKSHRFYPAAIKNIKEV